MKTKIQKWGNSLGVRLPKLIAEQKDLQENVEVEVLLKEGQIVIEPLNNDKKSLAAQYKAMASDELREKEVQDWLDMPEEGLESENVWRE